MLGAMRRPGWAVVVLVALLSSAATAVLMSFLLTSEGKINRMILSILFPKLVCKWDSSTKKIFKGFNLKLSN